MQKFAPADIVGTRWLSSCGNVIHEVFRVWDAGTKKELLLLASEDAETGAMSRGFITGTYDDVTGCCTPMETK